MPGPRGFGIDGTLEQRRVLGDESSLLSLQHVDHRALLGQFVLPTLQLARYNSLLHGLAQRVDHCPMVGVDGIARDVGLARQARHAELVAPLLQ